jgi:predicted GIY-YIG superfamily endonuclease
MPFTYIVRCSDDTLYVGHTSDLAAREQTHNDGKGAKYTAARRPVRIVYAEEHASLESAIARERQLKRWSKEKKEALVRGDSSALRSLSHRTPRSPGDFRWRDLLICAAGAPPSRRT